MATHYSNELAGINSVPAVKASAFYGYGAGIKRYRATIPLAAQASGDTIVLAELPQGESFAGIHLVTDTSLGTATLEIGDATTANLYSAAATFTAVNAPALLGTAAASLAAPYASTEQVIATIGTAALPASGNLVIDIFTSCPV